MPILAALSGGDLNRSPAGLKCAVALILAAVEEREGLRARQALAAAIDNPATAPHRIAALLESEGYGIIAPQTIRRHRRRLGQTEGCRCPK